MKERKVVTRVSEGFEKECIGDHYEDHDAHCLYVGLGFDLFIGADDGGPFVVHLFGIAAQLLYEIDDGNQEHEAADCLGEDIGTDDLP